MDRFPPQKTSPRREARAKAGELVRTRLGDVDILAIIILGCLDKWFDRPGITYLAESLGSRPSGPRVLILENIDEGIVFRPELPNPSISTSFR